MSPTRAGRSCRVATCAELAPCPTHGTRRAAVERWRGTAASRGYDYQWQRFRERVLAKRPLCEDCQDRGHITLAIDVHHIRKVTDYPAGRLLETNVKPLCRGCHNQRTAAGE